MNEPLSSLVERIDALLPQTQCQACHYAACKPYAEAIVYEQASMTLCAPGGVETLAAIATVLQRPYQALVDTVLNNERKPSLAVIDEALCIGCTKCIQACPVDAIIGAGKQMHVILQAECTGCELCLPPCPVDCITIHPLAAPTYDKEKARSRYDAKVKRLEKKSHEKQLKKPSLLAMKEALALASNKGSTSTSSDLGKPL